MIELIVTINGKRHTLDTSGDENINITYNIDDIFDKDAKNASYSKDFQLPATTKNNRIFNHFYEPSRYTTATSFDPNTSYEAELLVDGHSIMLGFLRVLDVVEKSKERFYKVVIYDDAANFFQTLGDDVLSDLDFSALDHTRYVAGYNVATDTFGTSTDYDNMVNSWTNGIFTDTQDTTSAATFNTSHPTQNTEVLYPLVANSNPYLDPGQNTFRISANWYNNAYPLSLNLKHVFNKIFEHAGFQFTSAFLNTPAFTDVYFDLGTALHEGNANQLSVHVAEGGPSDLNTNAAYVLGNTPATAINFPMTETQDDTGGFDATNQTYTMQAPGDVTVLGDIKIQEVFGTGAATPSPAEVFTIARVTNNPDASLNGDYALAAFSGASTTVFPGNVQTHIFDGTIYNLGIGAEIEVLHYALHFQTGGARFHTGPATSGMSGHSGNILGFHVDSDITMNFLVSKCYPDIKLADLVRDVFKVFNLVTEPIGTKQLKIEPYSDFTTGAILDWSKKVDINNAKVQPLPSIKEITLKFAEVEDFYLDGYRDLASKNYGDATVIVDPDAEETHEVQLEVFGPAYTQYQEDGLGCFMHIGKQLQNYPDYIFASASKPRLFYKNSQLIDASAFGGIVIDDLSTTHNNTASAHIYSDIPAQASSSTNILSFGLIEQVNASLPMIPSVNTLYNLYYADFVNERYDNSDSILYTVNIKLSPTDIHNFSFQNRIRIKDVIYKVNKIMYNTDRNKTAKIELLRV
tara:strand:+ start:17598 stop:19835 length:2238 start_codon:yes stop_codon:yes gene_type:complete